MKKQELLAKGTLLLTSLIWGAGFIISQVALDAGFLPAALMTAKFGIAAVLLGIIFRKAIRKNMSWGALRRTIPIGIVLAASFFAQTLGLQRSTPSNCALITATYVVLTPFLWMLVFRRRPSPMAYIASVICFAGVALLSFDAAGGFGFRVGDLWTLLAAVLFAIQIVATEAVIGNTDYKLVLFIEMATAALVSFILFIVFERDFSAVLSTNGLLSILFLGTMSTCLCYVMQTSAQRYVSSGAAALILSLESLFGAALSVIVGYDPAEPRLIIGGALVMLAVILPEATAMLKERKTANAENMTIIAAKPLQELQSGHNDNVV